MIKASLAVFPATLCLALSLSHPCLAQAPSAGSGQLKSLCREGSNTIEFTFDGKGHAKLTRLEGGEIQMFPDMKEKDWTVRFVTQDGAPSFLITNRLGAVMTLLMPPPSGETVGHLALSSPAGGKIDWLCDVTREPG